MELWYADRLYTRHKKVRQAIQNCVKSHTNYQVVSTPLLTQLHWLKVPECIKFKLAIQMPTTDSSAVPCWGTSSVICWRGSSASPLCIDIISLVVRRTRLLTNRDRAFPVAAARLEHCRWTSRRHRQYLFSGNIEDPSLQSFFPWISCSACALTLSFWTLISTFLFTHLPQLDNYIQIFKSK